MLRPAAEAAYPSGIVQVRAAGDAVTVDIVRVGVPGDVALGDLLNKAQTIEGRSSNLGDCSSAWGYPLRAEPHRSRRLDDDGLKQVPAVLRQGAAASDWVETADLGDGFGTMAAAGGQVVAGAAPILIEERSETFLGGEGPIEESLAGGETLEFSLGQTWKRQPGFCLGVRRRTTSHPWNRKRYRNPRGDEPDPTTLFVFC